jgi:hypothetical protein
MSLHKSLLAVVAMGVAWPQIAVAQASFAASRELTYAADVAPIIQENCVRCHHPGTSAPMALETYEQVRRWSQSIRRAVETRAMPPGWYIDHTVGIQDFKNDPSLSNEEIATITAWVDQGAPLGDPAQLPAPRVWRGEHEYWQLEDEHGWGPPDVIITSPPFTVPAVSGDQWWEPEATVNDVLDIPISGPRWIRALETRPANAKSGYVFHHANTDFVRTADSDGGGLSDAAVGKRVDM